jgi:hypothetical protein
VRTFAGQQITLSAQLKQFSGTVGNIQFFVTQKFGTGGSPSADVTTKATAITADGNWSLKSGTITVPAVASKTAGTNANDELWIGIEVSAASNTFNLGVDNFQVELGATATAFEDVKLKDWQLEEVVAGAGTLVAKTGEKYSVGWKPNVVQNVSTSQYNLTLYSWGDVTGQSCTITPRLATSKILVEVRINAISGNSGQFFGRLLRGSDVIGVGALFGSRTQAGFAFTASVASGHDRLPIQTSYQFLDSPNTISATTYKIQAISPTGVGNLYINRGAVDVDNANHASFISTITLTEIPV